MRLLSIALLLPVAGCQGVDGDAFEAPLGTRHEGPPMVALDPPRGELGWWRAIGSPSEELASATIVTSDASFIFGRAGEAIEGGGLSFMYGNYIHGIADVSSDVTPFENGELNVSSISRSLGGNVDETLLDAATDDDGAIWIAGGVMGHANFGGPFEALGNGVHAAYVIRHSGDLGPAQVSTFIATAAQTNAVSISGSRVYAAITYEGSLSAGVSALAAQGPGDGAIVALDAGGATRWAQRIGGPGRDEALAVAALSDGAVVVGRTDGGVSTGGRMALRS